MAAQEAKKLCPQLIIIQVRHGRAVQRSSADRTCTARACCVRALAALRPHSLRAARQPSAAPQTHHFLRRRHVQVPVAHGKADLTIYRDAGASVLGLLAGPTIITERASIDEFYIDITEAAAQHLAAAAAARGPAGGSAAGDEAGGAAGGEAGGAAAQLPPPPPESLEGWHVAQQV